MRNKTKTIFLAAALTFACASTVFAGWQKDEKGYWYQYDDGSFAKVGIKDIGGTHYAFDEQGYMLTGWQYIGWRWYYFSPDTGAQAFGWLQTGGKWYYMDPNNGGAMHTYWLDIGKDRYYLDEQGVMQVGVFYLSDSTIGSTYGYEANESGVLYRNTMRNRGNITIRYDDAGIMMYRNSTSTAVGDATGDGSWQYFLNEADMNQQQEDNKKVIQDEAKARKDSLFEEYKKKVAPLKSSKEKRRTAWEAKVRKKLDKYLSAEEIEAYIQEVEKGRYVKSTSQKYNEEDEEDVDYYYDNYDE